MTREEIQAYINFIQALIDSLLTRYPNGVKPGWVSEEISFLTMEKMKLEKQLKELNDDATD